MSYFGVKSSNPLTAHFSPPVGSSDEDLFIVGNISTSTTKSVVVTRNQRGEFVTESAQSTGETENISLTMNSITADDIEEAVLTLGNAAATAVTQFTINTQAGQFATISITGHKHTESGAVHNKSEREIELPTFAGFGASAFGLSLGVTENELQSSSFQVSIDHKDEVNKGGGFLCGSSYGVTVTANFEAISDTVWSIPTGWTVQTGNLGTQQAPQAEENNTSHVSRRLTIVKYYGPTEASISYASAS